MNLTNPFTRGQLPFGDETYCEGQMDYWMDKAPKVETTGDNVRMTGHHGVVMPRSVAIKLARGLLSAVAQLEDRAANDPVPIPRRA